VTLGGKVYHLNYHLFFIYVPPQSRSIGQSQTKSFPFSTL